MPYTQLARIQMTAGDTLPELVVRVTNIATRPQSRLNLQGYTVKLILKRPSPAPVLIKTGLIVDAQAGVVVFSWEPTDFVAGRKQPAEIQLRDPNGRTSSFGNLQFNVGENLFAGNV